MNALDVTFTVLAANYDVLQQQVNDDEVSFQAAQQKWQGLQAKAEREHGRQVFKDAEFM